MEVSNAAIRLKEDLGVSRRVEDQGSSSELLKGPRSVLRAAVDEVLRSEAREAQFLLHRAPRDSNRVEAHLGGELKGEMAEAANADNGNEIAGLGGLGDSEDVKTRLDLVK